MFLSFTLFLKHAINLKKKVIKYIENRIILMGFFSFFILFVVFYFFFILLIETTETTEIRRFYKRGEYFLKP